MCSHNYDHFLYLCGIHWHIDRLVHKRRNSSALALELRLSCINPSIWRTNSSLGEVMACHLSGTKPLPKPTIIIPLVSTKWKGGRVFWFHLVRLSVRPSVRLWTESCPLCIFNNTGWNHFIFVHAWASKVKCPARFVSHLHEICMSCL